MFDNILMALGVVFTIRNILVCLIGVITGIIVGALPGFTAAMGIAVLIPLTFGLDPNIGLVFLASLYIGAVYGGSISAILINTPGTDSAAATAIDGYEMTKKGRGREALTESAIASGWGGIMSNFALLLIAPPLARFALRFGPPEYFLLAVFGLTIIITFSAESIESLIKGLIVGIIGLLIGTIGFDPLFGIPRFTLKQVELLRGVSLIPALIGLFSLSQMFILSSQKKQSIVTDELKNIGKYRVRINDFFKYFKTYIRGGILGTMIGIIPGAGTSIAAFIGYNEARRFSKHPDEFGKGCREGVAGPESANNAVVGGSLIPTLTLGIPGNSVTAVLLGGLIIMGLRPGHELFTLNAHIIYPFIITLFMANIFMILIGIFGVPYLSNFVKLPVSFIIPFVIVLSVLGSYAINNSIFDVYLVLFFGLAGYFLRINGFSTIPIVLGIILGPIAERGLIQTTGLARSADTNIITFFITRPICIILIILIIISLLTPIIKYNLFSYRAKIPK